MQFDPNGRSGGPEPRGCRPYTEREVYAIRMAAVTIGAIAQDLPAASTVGAELGELAATFERAGRSAAAHVAAAAHARSRLPRSTRSRGASS
jgi:hypothetical protein